MWSNPKSAKVVVDENLRRGPPYCANPECAWHDPERSKAEGRFARYGKRAIARYPYVSIRFRCRRCRTTFSDSFFTLSYRDHLNDSYEEIFDLLNGGWTRRRTAKRLKCSFDTVKRRVRKLARQSLLQQAYRARNLKIGEPIAFDGLENFSYSQFDPNNINHAVGKKSFYIYDFNFSPLNRKGRMSATQMRKKKRLDDKYGTYPPRAIQWGAARVFERLLSNSDGELTIHTDNHYAYREAFKELRARFTFSHVITPGRAHRNFQNNLFPINHVDNLTRQRSSSFKRETVSFAKHSIAMVESFSLFMAEKNFMQTVLEKPRAFDLTAHKESPAMRVGLCGDLLKFRDFFRVRVTKAQVKLSSDWSNFVARIDETSRRPIEEYGGI